MVAQALYKRGIKGRHFSWKEVGEGTHLKPAFEWHFP